MTVDFDDRRSEDADDGDVLKSLAEEVVRATLEADRITLQVNVGLTLMDNDEIRTINNEFREIDEPTDVLSFPMTDYDLRMTPKDAMLGDIDPASDELVLGDIVVSVQRAREQAVEYGHTFQREFGYLVVHGMLHLLGYDHMEKDQADLMRSMEEKVLGSLSLIRSCYVNSETSV